MKGSSAATTAPRSESEKEKTKMRERQRRAITGKIFHGLRKHGGYRLSPRADINEVLRHLAAEAGWSVHSDGTTFRSSVGSCCPACGAARSSATATPTSSAAVGGECSTTASPLHYDGLSGPISEGGNLAIEGEVPMALYGYGGVFSGGIQQFQLSSVGFLGGSGGASQLAFKQQLQEARASNPSTPSGSPLRRGNYGSQ